MAALDKMDGGEQPKLPTTIDGKSEKACRGWWCAENLRRGHTTWLPEYVPLADDAVDTYRRCMCEPKCVGMPRAEDS